jgi:hypothetical protein
MKTLIVTVAGIILGLAASAAGVYWLAILATVIAIAGAVMQYRDSLPYEMLISESAWAASGDAYRIVVAKHTHKKLAPVGTLYQGQDPTFNEVICDVSHDSEAAVTFTVGRPIRGKLVIK